jgi:hypothetical protein
VKGARYSAGDAAWSALDGNAFDPAERVVEQKIIREFGRSGSMLRPDPQSLDLVEPASDLAAEMLALLGRKLKPRELDQVQIERVRQPEEDLPHQMPADTRSPLLFGVSTRHASAVPCWAV